MFLQITKKAVDSYRTGQRIPSCQLRAEWTKQSKPLQLTYHVTLEGAKKPYNCLCIVLDCDLISPAGIPSNLLDQYVYALHVLSLALANEAYQVYRIPGPQLFTELVFTALERVIWLAMM